MRPTALLGELGLKKTYGIDITGVDPKGVGTTQAKRAVQSGQDQMVLTTTTDATLDEFLASSSSPTTNICRTPTTSCPSSTARARRQRGRHQGVGKVKNDVLTTADLASMNQQVDSWRRGPRTWRGPI